MIEELSVSPAESRGRLERPGGHFVAWRRLEGSGPTVVWLGGFNSDMGGTKAEALAAWAEHEGRAFVRFDYFGHGASTGVLKDGTISHWREDALAVIDILTQGPIVLVGSSMGGWIAVLCALARPERIVGLVLIAPALDMTEKLIEPVLGPAARAALAADGVWIRPSPHGPGDAIGAALIEDGRRWSLLPAQIPLRTPLHVLQGGEDADVPWRHAFSIVEAWAGRDVVFTLVRDGDHRLSRPKDLERLIAATQAMAS